LQAPTNEKISETDEILKKERRCRPMGPLLAPRKEDETEANTQNQEETMQTWDHILQEEWMEKTPMPIAPREVERFTFVRDLRFTKGVPLRRTGRPCTCLTERRSPETCPELLNSTSTSALN